MLISNEACHLICQRSHYSPQISWHIRTNCHVGYPCTHDSSEHPTIVCILTHSHVYIYYPLVSVIVNVCFEKKAREQNLVILSESNVNKLVRGQASERLDFGSVQSMVASTGLITHRILYITITWNNNATWHDMTWHDMIWFLWWISKIVSENTGMIVSQMAYRFTHTIANLHTINLK